MITNKFLKGPLLAAFFISTSFAAEVSITIDDFQVRSAAADEAILKALEKHNVKAGLFVSCQYLDRPEMASRLPYWEKSGHLIANHTYSHKNYNKSEFDWYVQDIKKCHEMLIERSGFSKLFRFPMLKGGNTKEQRDQMQTYLKSSGYKNGYVTIDTSDWYISDRLQLALEKNPNLDLKKYRNYYLDHIWERSQYYENLAQKHWKKPLKHTLLIHHNLLNSFFLDDLIAMYKSKGWKVIDATDAFKDPIFDQIPDVLPFGESIVWSFAKLNGDSTLRMPGEDSTYEEKKMNDLGL